MKKLILVMLVFSVFGASTCFADEPIPSRYLPILQDWNATTTEELHLNIIEYWKSIDTTPDNMGIWTVQHYPLKIRFGGTTKELIADKNNWQLAIVSSKDVDLQTLAEHKALDIGEDYPDSYMPALYQWLLPNEFAYLRDPKWIKDVFVYDYDAEANDATLLICQPVPQCENPPMARLFAEEIMWKRSADIARAVQGLRWIPDKAKWTEEEFLAQSKEWDVGILRLKKDQIPSLLDETGLLYDFSQIDYFASRTSIKMPEYLVDLANGVFNANDQMVGIPCVLIHVSDPDTVGMLIVNAKSPVLDRALQFAEHFMKALERDWCGV